MAKFKRGGAVLAALLAVILSLAWTVPAQAVNYSHSVTFEGVGSGDQVNAYKLVGYTNGYNGFRVDGKFKRFLESSENPFYDQLSSNPSDEDIIEFLTMWGTDEINQILSAYVSTWGNNPPSNPETASGPSANLSFEPGYYLVLPTVSDARLYSPLSLFVRVDGTKSFITVGEKAETEEDNVTVNLKYQEGPTFEKYLVDGSDLAKTGTTSVGQKVTFAIKVQFGQLADGFDPKPAITDTLTNLEFDENSVKVHKGNVDGDVIDNAVTTSVEGDDSVKMELDWDKISWGGSPTTVFVTYEATVTNGIVAGASAGGPYVGTNSAQLTYVKDVLDNTATTDASEASVYTFGLSLAKLDMSRNALTGAKFQLYTVDGSDAVAVKLSQVGDYYVVDNAGTMSELEANGGTGANELDIRGLDPSQTYVIRESETPNGYFAPSSGWKVTLAPLVDANTGRHTGNLGNATVVAENGEQAVADLASITTSGATARLAVQNSTMPVLPSTGGMGTALFTVGGMALMAVAAVAFVLLRRRED